MLNTMRLIAALMLSLCAVALGVPARTGAQEPPDVVVNQLDAAAYPELSAIVTAIDARGVPKPGLTAADFRAFEADAPVAITGVTAAQDASVPLSVILVVDVSGSMAGAPIEAARAAATQFVASLAPADQAALYSFSSTVNVVVPLTADRSQLNAGIAGLQAFGPTALYQAVEASVFAAVQAPGGRKAIVLLSDGKNDSAGSTSTAPASIVAARAAGVPVFGVGLGDPDDAYLQLLADETQGAYQRASTGGLGDVYGRIATLLRSQYIVTMRATGAADGAEAVLRIEATLDGLSVSSPPTAFTRGVPGVVPTAVPTRGTVAQPDASGGSGGGANIVLIGVLAVVAAAVLLTGGTFYMRWVAAREAVAQQEATVAPNPRLAAAQPVPQPDAAMIIDPVHGAGRLVIVDGMGAGDVVLFSSQPLVLGADARSGIRITRSSEVASKHAQVWMKVGKIMLRHLAGTARQTNVNGKPVEWVILDEGDVIAIGESRLRAEVVGPHPA